MNFWSRIKILIFSTTLPDPGSTHIAIGAKADGLYIRKPGGTDKRLLTEDDSTGGSTAATATGTLLSSGWSSNSQTISVTGVTASKIITVSPAATLANVANYADAGIICSSQGAGTLTFVCVRQPISNINVNVLIQS